MWVRSLKSTQRLFYQHLGPFPRRQSYACVRCAPLVSRVSRKRPRSSALASGQLSSTQSEAIFRSHSPGWRRVRSGTPMQSRHGASNTVRFVVVVPRSAASNGPNTRRERQDLCKGQAVVKAATSQVPQITSSATYPLISDKKSALGALPSSGVQQLPEQSGRFAGTSMRPAGFEPSDPRN